MYKKKFLKLCKICKSLQNYQINKNNFASSGSDHRGPTITNQFDKCQVLDTLRTLVIWLITLLFHYVIRCLFSCCDYKIDVGDDDIYVLYIRKILFKWNSAEDNCEI